MLHNSSARFISPEAIKKAVNRNKRLESRATTALQEPSPDCDVVCRDQCIASLCFGDLVQLQTDVNYQSPSDVFYQDVQDFNLLEKRYQGWFNRGRLNQRKTT
ncbi:MAG: hypothetical protein Q7J76_08780 [Candidatus Brocadiaceae bacterium]|uniref:hypothetical protein n=1 Tax=Candidatus Wunengus sp. YC61 TaxID=3367698 RepID=UPI00271D2CB6|nr:hypothetical protein [Candidatus Brocadiaceae bacterium]